MPDLPAHCDNCGLTWVPPGGIRIGSGTSITFTGGWTINCPRCDHRARFLEGTFDVEGDTITVLAGSVWSRERLQEFRRSLQSTLLAWPDLDVEQAIQRIETVSPEAGGLLRGRSWSRADLLALLTFLATVVFGLISLLPDDAPQTVRIDPQQVRQVIEELQQSSGAPDSPPAGKPTPGSQTPQPPNRGKQPPAVP